MNFSYTVNLTELFKLIFVLKITEKDFINYWSNQKINKILPKSSWSISLIAELKKKEVNNRKINIFFPDYYCSYAISLIDKNIANIIFYPINSEDKIDINYFNQLNTPIDVLVSVNYFGEKKTTAILFDYCREKKIWLIEDSTHVILPKTKKIFGDFIIYSQHKHLPAPLGAILVFNDNGPNNLVGKLSYLEDQHNWNKLVDELAIKFLNLKKSYFILIRWILKNIIRNFFKTKNHIKSFSENDVENLVVSPRLDKISKKVLLNSSYYIYKTIVIRNKSFFIWKNFFKTKNILNINSIVKDDFFPNSFSIFGKYKNILKIYNILKKNNMPVSTWPDLDPVVAKKTVLQSAHLRRSRIFLPIHSLENIIYLKKRFDLKSENLNQQNIKIVFADFSAKEWNKQLEFYDNVNFLQSWEHGYSKSFSLFFLKRKFIKIFYKNELIAVSQIFEIFFIIKFYFLNRGPIFKKNLSKDISSSVIVNLASKIPFKKFSLLLLSPNLNSNEVFSHKLKTNFFFFKNVGWSSSIINLSESVDEIKSKMKHHWRNLINKNNYLLNIDMFNSHNIEDFNYIKLKYYQNNNYSKLSKKYLDCLYNLDSLKVFVCKKNGIIESGIFVSVAADTATYLISYSSNISRDNNLNYYLIWFVINFLKIKNIKYFDTGGIDFVNNYNVAKFKKSMGGKPYEIHGLHIF
jgi:hypothetical protein